MWKKLNFEVGEKGTEGGIVVMDEEYKRACRITLEKCEKYYAITCGVYGAMVHTVFCNEKDSKEIYKAMKHDLAEFIDRETTEQEEFDFYELFTSKYQIQ